MTAKPSSAATAIQRAANQHQTYDAADGCFICQKQLWLSFFFDEPRHDAEKEKGGETLSNIGKLYFSHVRNEDRGIYRLYYNGLGVALNAPNIARRQTAKESGKEEAEKIAKDKLKDAGQGEWKKLLSPKSLAGDLLGLAAKVGIEASDLRDKPTVSQLTLSGVKTRVDNALLKLDEIIKDQQIPVTRVRVAVFGSGLGGAMARLFINNLREKCRRDGDRLFHPTPNGEAEVELCFLGLLDCVSSTADGNPVTDFVAGKLTLGLATLRIEGPMGIARAVQQTVHYVAGHELRLTQRLDSVRKAEGSFREVVLPGNHDDIVGGCGDGFLNRSNQLARHALVELHGNAYGAGVPMLSMEKLEARDFKLYQDFQFTRKIAVANVEYGARGLVRHYGATSGTLENQLLEHTRRLLSWMRLRHATPGHPKRPPEAAYQLLETQMNRLRTMLNHPHSRYRMPKEIHSLLTAWEHPQALSPHVEALFDEFVHDALYESIPDQMAADAANNGYLKLRGIDASDEIEKKKIEKPSLPMKQR